MEYTDFLIECRNPSAFDRTIQELGAAVLSQNPDGSYRTQEDYHVMRVYGDPGFIVFAIKSQGYGKVIRQLEEPPPTP